MTDLRSYYADQGSKVDLMDTSDCRNWISDCKCLVCKSVNTKKERKMISLFEDYSLIGIETTDTLTPHMYFLCSYDIMAFVFRTRRWGELKQHCPIPFI